MLLGMSGCPGGPLKSFPIPCGILRPPGPLGPPTYPLGPGPMKG